MERLRLLKLDFIDKNTGVMYYIVAFIIIALINFYFFGMHRTALQISRILTGNAMLVEFLLPAKYYLVWFFRLAKWALLALLFVNSWKVGLIALASDCVFLFIIPVPRGLYKGHFIKRLKVVSKKIPNIGLSILKNQDRDELKYLDLFSIYNNE